jgi:hypothetical protein
VDLGAVLRSTSVGARLGDVRVILRRDDPEQHRARGDQVGAGLVEPIVAGQRREHPVQQRQAQRQRPAGYGELLSAE